MPLILFVDNFKLDFDNPMSTLYINKCKKICESPLVRKVDISDKKSVEEAIKSDFNIVLFGQRCPEFYKANKHFAKIIRQNLGTLVTKINSLPNIKKYMLLQDTHPKTYGSLENLTNWINKEKLDLIFTFFENSESRHIRRVCTIGGKSRFFHLPHHIDTLIFNNSVSASVDAPKKEKEEGVLSEAPKKEVLTKERPYDIILYGDIHPTHYPFRKRLFELILNKADEKNIKVLYVTPPVDSTGKSKVFDPDKCEAGLAAKIRSAKYAIATKSKYDYLVAKYLEIAACETTLMGDMATDGDNLPEFSANYVKLTSKMSDDEIINTIVQAICTYDTNPVSKNRKEFAQHIMDNYNLDKYQEKLLGILLS